MLEEVKILSEIHIKKPDPRACFSGIFDTIKWPTQTKFSQKKTS